MKRTIPVRLREALNTGYARLRRLSYYVTRVPSKLREVTNHRLARRVWQRRYQQKRLWTPPERLRQAEVLDRSFRERFWINPDTRLTLLGLLEKHDPGHRDRTLAAADHTLRHEVDLLGSGWRALGDPIDWHRDFKSDYRWEPHTYYLDVSSAPAPDGRDIKVAWDLSRAQFLPWLGQAFWWTDDTKYLDKFTGLIGDWIESVPPYFGAPWRIAMEAAIRAVNWLWGYAYFQDHLSDDFKRRFFSALRDHGKFIRGNLEKNPTTSSNHYLSNLVGLIYLGAFLPQLPEAASWLKFGLREMWSQMRVQIYPDGVDYEASTSYHRMVAEFYLHAILIARQVGQPIPPDIPERLALMIEYLYRLTRPDGTIPLIGDNDNGRLVRLDVFAESLREWSDMRNLLGTAGVYFGRLDWQAVGSVYPAEAIWLLGKPPSGASRDRPISESVCYPHGGVHILRCGDDHATFNAASAGLHGGGGHNHNDTLSLTLARRGVTFIDDPGAFVYVASPAERNRFRGTGMHSTVVVDGEEINPIPSHYLFTLPGQDKPELLRWVDDPRYTLAVGQHHGYERLKDPVLHRRAVMLVKREGLWLVRDTLRAAGRHSYRQQWILAPSIRANVLRGSAVQLTHADGQKLYLHWFPGDTTGEISVSPSEFSPGFGVKVPSFRVDYSLSAEGDLDLLTVFAPEPIKESDLAGWVGQLEANLRE